MAQDKTTQSPLTPKVALGVAAHADDLDFMAGGTCASWATQGTEVYYLILTNGNKGSADPDEDLQQLTETRRDEQRAAAKLLGVKEVLFLDYDDGCLDVSMALKRDIARVIRRLKPEVVVTFDPTMIYNAGMGLINHPDHRAAGQATLDAVYPLARDCHSFPELYLDEHLEPHNVGTVLLSSYEKQDFFVDITETFDAKQAAVAAHASQHLDAAVVARFARQTGEQAGCSYAECFVRIDVASF